MSTYTKYVELTYLNEHEFPHLCGKEPVSKRVIWRDVHDLPNPPTDIDEPSYVPVFSHLRGWRWNRKAILNYLNNISLEMHDLNFFLYHEQELREVLGNKHFKDLLKELGWYHEFCEERKTYVHPGRIAAIVHRESTERRHRCA